MSLVFPKWTNAIPAVLVGGLGATAFAVVVGTWYYATPDFFEIGYQPEQPVAFSHRIHSGQLGIDCRYCHTNVEESAHSNVPDTATCMSCHTGDVATDQAYLRRDLWLSHKENEHLVELRSNYQTGEPIQWRRIHKLPDYAHFNHAVHVNAGVSCYSCHGRIDQHEVARQVESLSMGWCLDCHRNPEQHLVAVSDTDPMKPRITDLGEIAQQLKSGGQRAAGLALIEELGNEPPQSCGACHY